METLDAIDSRLIDLLREDSSRPVKSLAARLGISIATVTRRREALEERGVIRRYTIEVDPSRAGRPALVLVEASLASASDQAVADFKRRMLDCPDVVECYHLMGDSSFLLLVALADRAELPRFSQWLSNDGAGPVTMRASPVLDQVKPA
jgi:DNA-binding Lrp family transcriptional regulator